MSMLVEQAKTTLVRHLEKMFANRHLGSELDACYVVVEADDAYVQVLAPPTSAEPLVIEAASTDYVPALANILDRTAIRKLKSYGFTKKRSRHKVNFERDPSLPEIVDADELAEFILNILKDCYGIRNGTEISFEVNTDFEDQEEFDELPDLDEDTTDEELDYDSQETSFQGHGNHWGAFLDDAEQAVSAAIPLCLSEGRPIPNQAPAPEEDESDAGDGYMGLESPDTPLRVVSLLQVEPHQKAAFLVSAYPAAVDGIVHRLRVTKICEWSTKIEAVIHAEFPEGPSICFFDPYYIRNRNIWKPGMDFDVSLGGLAMTLKPSAIEDITITDPDVIRAMTEIQSSQHDRDSVDIPDSIAISTEGMACFFSSESYPDEAEIRGPVKAVSKFHLLGREILCYRCTVLRLTGGVDGDVDVNIYAARDKMDVVADVGSDIQGRIWVNGTLPFTADR